MRSLRIKCSKAPLLTVERSKQWKKKMVYILTANKTYKYPSGRRSRIIYIGTTGKGAQRPATSAVDKAGVFTTVRKDKLLSFAFAANSPGKLQALTETMKKRSVL